MIAEIVGVCVVLLFKYRTKVFNILQTIYRSLVSPPPRWYINKRELCDKRFHVGETVKFVIKYVGEGTFHEDLACLRLQILQNSQPIVHLKEVLEAEKLIQVKFTVQKAIITRIELYDRNQIVSQSSPINLSFLPGLPEPDKTICLKPSPIIQCTTFLDKRVHIQPRDKFDNNCLVCDVDLDTFKFQAKISDHSVEESEICDSTFVFASYFSSEILLKIQFHYPGIFNGSITLNDQVIGGHGTFNIVSLTNAEETSLQYILANSPSWKYHEGRLRALDNKIDSRNKKIYIYVSPKQISVQEYILRFIPLRIATFRVSPMTKMELLFADNDQNNYTFSIHDCIQPKVTIEMDQSSTRLVYAMFTHFLQKRHGRSESFADKQKFFYTELSDVRNKGGTLRISFMTLKISREDIINSTLQSTYYYNAKDWCRNFRIEFEEEEGLDGGGLRREWLDLLCAKLFENSETGLFCSFGNSRLTHPNPNAMNTTWTKRHFELAGKIVGKCLFESAMGDAYKTMVNGRFTRSFLAQVLGLRPNYKHFEQDDPELYMSKVKYILENDVDKLELTFSDEEYIGQFVKNIDLVPNGSTKLVTNENKEEYLNALANYRLGTKVKKEIEGFCKGLHYIVPDELLSQFDENELELLMCGKSEFSVSDLRKNFSASFTLGFDTDYKRVVEWFFMSVENMTDDEKAKLLQFVTGSSLLPHGGFANLSPRLRIILGAEYGKLPTAQTCANQICLSDHNSFEDFEKCLLLAVNEGNQGFGFK